MATRTANNVEARLEFGKIDRAKCLCSCRSSEPKFLFYLFWLVSVLFYTFWLVHWSQNTTKGWSKTESIAGNKSFCSFFERKPPLVTKTSDPGLKLVCFEKLTGVPPLPQVLTILYMQTVMLLSPSGQICSCKSKTYFYIPYTDPKRKHIEGFWQFACSHFWFL